MSVILVVHHDAKLYSSFYLCPFASGNRLTRSHLKNAYQDKYAAQLEKAEEAILVAFPSGYEASEIMKPFN